MSENTWTIGYDVGQVRDPSALVVAESIPTPTGRGVHRITVRRGPIGSTWTRIL